LVKIVVGPNEEEIVVEKMRNFTRKMEGAIPPENVDRGVSLVGRVTNSIMGFEEGKGRVNDKMD
jgi:hypothetical protein